MEEKQIISFTIEDGTDIQLEVLEETKINGINYLLVVDTEEDDTAMILREATTEDQDIVYIPVEDDDIDSAIEKAEKIFYENELTEEYLNLRNLEYREDTSIFGEAEVMADIFVERYGTNLTKDEVYDYFYQSWNKNDHSSFVFDELLKKLEEKYNISFEKIKIQEGFYYTKND